MTAKALRSFLTSSVNSSAKMACITAASAIPANQNLAALIENIGYRPWNLFDLGEGRFVLAKIRHQPDCLICCFSLFLNSICAFTIQGEEVKGTSYGA